MPISFNEINEKANGGTEIMARRIRDSFTEEELEHVQIIPSRVRELLDDKVRIFWCHDLPNDPESENVLKNDGWRKFEKIVFVSHWQKQQYLNSFNIPPSKCIVMQNAIDPIPLDNVKTKPDDKIRLIYHTTPHRGLDLAYYAVNELAKHHPEIEFNVFSSFKIYGWEQRDEQFQELYTAIDEHPNMVYHGTVSNSVVREYLEKSHIFAYPSVWPETSCISLMEAMSAKLMCVHSNLAALPETSANWTYMYDFNEDRREHVELFASCLNNAIKVIKNKDENMETRLMGQKSYADLFYNWELRKIQWAQFIDSLKSVSPKAVKDLREAYEIDEFVYGTS